MDPLVSLLTFHRLKMESSLKHWPRFYSIHWLWVSHFNSGIFHYVFKASWIVNQMFSNCICRITLYLHFTGLAVLPRLHCHS